MIVHFVSRAQVRELAAVFAMPAERNGKLVYRFPKWILVMMRHARKTDGRSWPKSWLTV